MSYLKQIEQGVQILIWAQPGAKKSEVVGVHDGALKVKLHAPAVEGAANDELIRFLAKSLNVSASSIEIIRGEKSRRKTVLVRGADLQSLTANGVSVFGKGGV